MGHPAGEVRLRPLFDWGTAKNEKPKCLQDVTQSLLAIEDRPAFLDQRHQIRSVIVPIGLLPKVRDVRGCRSKDDWRVVTDQYHTVEVLRCADHFILRSLIEFDWSVQVPSGDWTEPPRFDEGFTL